MIFRLFFIVGTFTRLEAFTPRRQPCVVVPRSNSFAAPDAVRRSMIPPELVDAAAAAASSTVVTAATATATATATLDPAVIDEARTAFFFWLFGASGGAGIARSAFPRMYDSFRELDALKDLGPTKQGGDILDISPLCGYPRPIYKADVAKILNQKLSVEQIVDKYPIEGNFLSARGYLTYQAFVQANPNANPLTLRLVFDSLNTSADVCSPDIAQERLDAYRDNLNALSTNVLLAKLSGYAAIFALLFLLALADYEAFVVHFRTGWFPEWPGLSNLPFSLFDSEIGLTSIPKYWLDEY